MNSIFYIAACAAALNGGIYSYRLLEDGNVRQVGFHQLDKASWITLSPDGKSLYSTCVVGKSSGVAACKINTDGSLTEHNRMSAAGKVACHLATDPGGKFLFCANYSSGSISIFALNEDGSLRSRLRNIQHTGRGSVLPRQNGPHPHFLAPTPDGKYLAVVDLGIDAVLLYPFDPVKGVDETKAATFRVEPAGSGPRHLTFDRSGKIAYLLNELGNTVMSLSYADGRFEKLNQLSTLPRGFRGVSYAAAIRLSADGTYRLASNRGFDSIAVFRLDGNGGMKLHDLVLSGGHNPCDINFLPGRRQLAAANTGSDMVFLFDYHPERGKLTPNGRILHHKSPQAICRREGNE